MYDCEINKREYTPFDDMMYSRSRRAKHFKNTKMEILLLLKGGNA